MPSLPQDKQNLSFDSPLPWKSFTFSANYYLLHTPSSQIMQVPHYLWQHVREKPNEMGRKKISDLAKQLLTLHSKTKVITINIQSIALNVIERCNLRCTYCYAGDGDYGSDSVMDFSTAKRSVDFFVKDQERFHIQFFGGEPLLNFRLIQKVVTYCRQQYPRKKFTFGITTNATLLTQVHLDFFKEHSFSLKISYDGEKLNLRKYKDDSASKINLPQLTLNKIHKFKEQIQQLRDFHLRATLTKEGIPLIAETLFSVVNSHEYKVAFARTSTDDREEIFTQKDIDKLGHILNQFVDDLLEKDKINQLLRIRNMKILIRKFHSNSQNQNFCSAGINYLSVSTSGDFYLCHRFTEDSSAHLGNLDKGLDLEKFETIKEHRMMTKKPCSNCWMRHFCGGGCFHEHKKATGSSFTIDPIFCQLQNVEMEQALKVYLHIMRNEPKKINDYLSS